MEEKEEKKSSLGCLGIIFGVILVFFMQCMGPVFKAHIKYKMDHAPKSVVEKNLDDNNE